MRCVQWPAHVRPDQAEKAFYRGISARLQAKNRNGHLIALHSVHHKLAREFVECIWKYGCSRGQYSFMRHKGRV